VLRLMATARVRRGRKSQELVADRIRHLYPDAKGVPASLPGKDVLHTPGMAIEVKATASVTLPAWLRQARKNALPGDLPVAIYRPNGAGPESIDDWGAVIPFGNLVELLAAAGYGEVE
jgi:hypothetical protein